MMKVLKVLLISSFKNENLRVGQYLSPPYGLYRIASYIRKKLGIDIEVFDPDLYGINKLYDLIESEKFDIIGFSLLQPTLKNDIPLIHSVSRLSPSSLLIAGGQGAVFNIDFLMRFSPLNIVVKGFGEFALEEILKNFNRTGSLIERFGDVRGLAIKNNEEIYNTPLSLPYTQEQFEEISLAFDFEKVPYEEYWSFMEKIYSEAHLKIMKNENMIRTIRLMSTSHCPMGCSFCSSTHFLDNATCNKQKLVSLTPEQLISLVQRAKSAHPEVESFYFCDDDLLQDRERIYKFCDLLEKNNEFKDITFFCLTRPDRIDSELLKKMYRNGFKLIIYGVDSFSNKILEDMNKKLSVNDKKALMSNSVIKTLDVGITPLMNIILFYPTVSYKDITETIETSLNLIERGARLSVYAYVEAYAGADILKDENLDFVYEEIKLNNQIIKIPKIVLPKTPEVKKLAEESIILRDLLIPSILKEYEWKGVVPHPLYGLALFLAVYKKLNLDTSKIESLIQKVMSFKQEIALENPLANKLGD